MSEKKKIPPSLHRHLSEAGKKGAKALSQEARSRGGKAGAASRWKNIPRCPTCQQPYPKRLRNAITAPVTA